MTDRARVAIVGAGPQGLSVALYLRAAGMSVDDIVVVDPTGGWLTRWRRDFSRLGIAHLRSPSVHHPHPDPYALALFAADRRRNDELVHRYLLPTTALFDAFCDHCIDEAGLGRSVRVASVISVAGDGRLTLSDGCDIVADHVVWATNPARAASWSHPLFESWTAVDTSASSDVPPTVAVVGGGLTAAHLVERALERGSHVEWVSRRPIVVREFDTDPGWLGPKEMAAFSQLSSANARLDAVLDARGGGSVPSWMMRRLSAHERAGRLCRRSGTLRLASDAHGPALDCVGTTLRPDVVWAALGDTPDASADPALYELCLDRSAELVGGRPVLDRLLRLPGTSVHVVGRLAQLELGPTAGNLAGARRAAEIVVGAVCGVDAMYALMDA